MKHGIDFCPSISLLTFKRISATTRQLEISVSDTSFILVSWREPSSETTFIKSFNLFFADFPAKTMEIPLYFNPGTCCYLGYAEDEIKEKKLFRFKELN